MEEGFYIQVKLDTIKDNEYYYCPFKVKKGDSVIVEGEFGLELGFVNADPIKEAEAEFMAEKTINRVASKDDIDKYNKNKIDSKDASKVFNDLTKSLKLNMRLVETFYNLDKSKILFRYISEERVDFRELLKELSNSLKCRIELKQIGPRDRSKAIGGIGICGLPLCCKSFLTEFEGISINMAKNQYLALNIQKISGQCGKLLCCLKYEDDAYSELKKNAPRYGFRFKHDGVDYKISGVNLLAKTVKIESFDKEIIKVVTFDEVNEMMKR